MITYDDAVEQGLITHNDKECCFICGENDEPLWVGTKHCCVMACADCVRDATERADDMLYVNHIAPINKSEVTTKLGELCGKLRQAREDEDWNEVINISDSLAILSDRLKEPDED